MPGALGGITTKIDTSAKPKVSSEEQGDITVTTQNPNIVVNPPPIKPVTRQELEKVSENTIPTLANVKNSIFPIVKPTINTEVSTSSTNQTINTNDEYYDVCNAKQTPQQVIDKAVPLEEIIGLSEAKTQIENAIFNPILYPKIYQDASKKFILLTGPPGTGKTTLVQAIAKKLQTPQFYGKIKVSLFQPNPSDLASSYQNESSKILTGIIRCASRVAKESENGVDEVGKGVAIIFFDEMESFAKARGTEKQEANIVPSFLAILESAETPSNIIIFGATNLEASIDSAIKSRFPKKIFVGPPDQNEIIQYYNLQREIFIKKKLKNGVQKSNEPLSLTEVDSKVLNLLSWGYTTEVLDELAKSSKEVRGTGRLLGQIWREGITENGNDLIERNLVYQFDMEFLGNQKRFGKYLLSVESIPPELWYTVYKLFGKSSQFLIPNKLGFQEKITINFPKSVTKTYVNAKLLPFVNVVKNYPFFVDIYYDTKKFEEISTKIETEVKNRANLYQFIKEYASLPDATIANFVKMFNGKFDILIQKNYYISNSNSATIENFEIFKDKPYQTISSPHDENIKYSILVGYITTTLDVAFIGKDIDYLKPATNGEKDRIGKTIEIGNNTGYFKYLTSFFISPKQIIDKIFDQRAYIIAQLSFITQPLYERNFEVYVVNPKNINQLERGFFLSLRPSSERSQEESTFDNKVTYSPPVWKSLDIITLDVFNSVDYYNGNEKELNVDIKNMNFYHEFPYNYLDFFVIDSGKNNAKKSVPEDEKVRTFTMSQFIPSIELLNENTAFPLNLNLKKAYFVKSLKKAASDSTWIKQIDDAVKEYGNSL